MNNEKKLQELNDYLKEVYYEKKGELLFHGWHHINFVRKKSKVFAQELGVDTFIVESSALVHDLNYIVEKNSQANTGKELRKEILKKCNYTNEEIVKIEKIVDEEEISTRDENISNEAKALSDADTLFKCLPFTPLLFSSKYLSETGIDIKKLSEKIISEQKPLMERGIYFYTKYANKHYLKWAKTNLELWNNLEESFEDSDMEEVITIAKELRVLK